VGLRKRQAEGGRGPHPGQRTGSTLDTAVSNRGNPWSAAV
jgi:hypothetical protein